MGHSWKERLSDVLYNKVFVHDTDEYKSSFLKNFPPKQLLILPPYYRPGLLIKQKVGHWVTQINLNILDCHVYIFQPCVES